jgi:hypothetical protein
MGEESRACGRPCVGIRTRTRIRTRIRVPVSLEK